MKDTDTDTDTKQDLGFIDWWEFAPIDDTFICRSSPDETKKTTESGLIIATQTDIIMDRPWKGEVISVGPTAKYNIGDFLYWQPNSGFDLAMIRNQEHEKFILLHNEAILGQRVKDTRK